MVKRIGLCLKSCFGHVWRVLEIATDLGDDLTGRDTSVRAQAGARSEMATSGALTPDQAHPPLSTTRSSGASSTHGCDDGMRRRKYSSISLLRGEASPVEVGGNLYLWLKRKASAVASLIVGVLVGLMIAQSLSSSNVSVPGRGWGVACSVTGLAHPANPHTAHQPLNTTAGVPSIVETPSAAAVVGAAHWQPPQPDLAPHARTARAHLPPPRHPHRPPHPLLPPLSAEGLQKAGV